MSYESKLPFVLRIKFAHSIETLHFSVPVYGVGRSTYDAPPAVWWPLSCGDMADISNLSLGPRLASAEADLCR